MAFTVSSVTDTAAGAAAMKKATGLNKDDFLNLFIAQIQNQDPLNPMDGTDFNTQLAQLTQVEQAYNTNTNLQNLIDAQNGTNSLASVAFLGNTITAMGSETSLVYGGQAILGFTLPSQATSVNVEIYNSQGGLVRTFALANSPAGNSTITWDGKDNAGQLLPSGIYSYSIKAANADGTAVTAEPLLVGKVDGISFKNDTPFLSVGGVQVPLSNVVGVKGA